MASALAALLIVGCNRDASEGANPVVRGPVVTVGSHVLTDEMVQTRVLFMEKMMLRKKPKATETERGKYRKMLTDTYPRFFVQDSVLNDYAVTNGLVVSENRIATNRVNVFSAYRRKGEKTYDDMLKALGDAGAELERQVRSEALAVEVKEHIIKSNPTNIPPSYADEVIANIEENNRAMKLTNDVLFATATNVWRRLQKGENFARLAAEFTQIEAEKEDGGYWGQFDAQLLDHEPQVLRFGRTAKPGELTPPIEADNGLMILRFNSREKDDAGVMQFSFSRIFFMLPEFYVPAPKDEIIKAAYTRYGDELYARKLREMIRAAKPVYRK